MNITSPVFDENDTIPEKYTCDGKNINPPLEVTDVPQGTKSLVLVVEDPDAPNGTWTHWVVWNIAPDADIQEDSRPGKQGENDFNKLEYGGPCPPDGEHRYFFKVYALDMELGHEEGADLADVRQGMEDHILEQAQLVGTYKRNG